MAIGAAIYRNVQMYMEIQSLMMVWQTIDGPVEGPDVSLRSCISSLLDFCPIS